MTHQLGLKSWATGALVLAAITACSNTDPGSEPSASPTESSSVSSAATPSSSPTSESEVASQAAEATVRRYFIVLDGLRQDPQTSLSDLATVASSIQLSSQRRLLQSERKKGYRQVGTTSLADLSVEAVNLSNSDPSTGQVPTVTIDVCWDVSGADLVDKDGQSVVSPSRATAGWTRYTVANYKWAEQPTAGWRIATSEDLKQEPCVGS